MRGVWKETRSSNEGGIVHYPQIHSRSDLQWFPLCSDIGRCNVHQLILGKPANGVRPSSSPEKIIYYRGR